MTIKILLFSFLMMINFSFLAQEKTNINNQNEELGKVSWYRNYHDAVAESKKTGKDILVLFQEVPGCATCRNYGHDVLSNPLLTEAIQNEFIPLAIFNNKGGHDKEILKQFNEPSWNNPVVRIIDHRGGDISGRVNADYSAQGLYNSMDTALKNKARNTPKYFELLGQELRQKKLSNIQETYFEMYCFWSGEQHFGKQEGVIETEAGFIGNKEVVKVRYNPNKISLETLTKYGELGNCKSNSQGEKFKISKKDVHYNLRHSEFRFLPLSDIQKTKINSVANNRNEAIKFLSPTQIKWLEMLDANEGKKVNYLDQDFGESWNEKLTLTHSN